MDLVNIIYRYVNRFINSDELIELLGNLDKTKFSKKEIKEIEKLIEEVKKIIEHVPIEIDEIEINRMNMLNRILENLEKMMSNKNSDEVKEFARRKYDSLVKDKEKIRDSGPRYDKLYDLLVNNSVYIYYCKKMSDLELLEFITQYISAPVTPNIDQETFDDLVSDGIKKDKREALWRLAFNYNGKEKYFSRIENYLFFYGEDMERRMNKNDLLKLIKTLQISKEEFWILSTGALVLRDIYPYAGDLDIAVTDKGLMELKSNYALHAKPNGWFTISDNIECVCDGEKKNLKYQPEKIGEYYVQNIFEYLEYLNNSEREKDKLKLALVKQYIEQNKKI